MGLITKRIEVEISGRNKPYYNRRGCLVPETIGNYGKISTPRGVKVIVSVDDLPMIDNIINEIKNQEDVI